MQLTAPLTPFVIYTKVNFKISKNLTSFLLTIWILGFYVEPTFN